MTYVITQNCCNDATCIEECPVDCIRPVPGEPGFETAEMLYIDPETCIDCGACMDVCPVDAIAQAEDLAGTDREFIDVNRRYFEAHPLRSKGLQRVPAAPRRMPAGRGPLLVAVVGTGPAACYAIEEILHNYLGDVRINIFEKTNFVGGLVRYGVAPDHIRTKGISRRFEPLLGDRRVELFLNVEIGNDISHEELAAAHHATIYATGAAEEKTPEIPGIDLGGSWSASEFVGWYNGHPDYSDLDIDLSARTAVVIGNGNVALDVARVLAADFDHLASTDIASYALDSLRRSRIEEVFVVGRRGPAEAAFTSPELLGLGDTPGARVDLSLGTCDLRDHTEAGLSFAASEKMRIMSRFQGQAGSDASRRIVLSFGRTPAALRGSERVEAIDFAPNVLSTDADGKVTGIPSGPLERLETGLVIRATGFRASALSGVPFSEGTGSIPHSEGRVVDPSTGNQLSGVYTCGWVKRGPQGVIGSNRTCAAESVGSLMADWAAGSLDAPSADSDSFADLIASRCPNRLGYPAWEMIDQAEVDAGKDSEAPRVKLTTKEEVVEVLGSAI